MKLGRLPRKHNPRVPHLSALLAGRRGLLAPPPPSADYTAGLPQNLGMFHNDSLGDCTCAAVYHALQVWSQAASGTIDTEPDDDAMLLYEQACGYQPGNANTDQGGNEQDVLSFVLLQGAPVGQGGNARHRLSAFVEVDPSNQSDVKLAIHDAGLVYIGFNVPDYIMGQPAGSTWDVQPGTPNIIGGHAVICAGYDTSGLKVISWGALYTMTWAFWNQFVDESYMLADQDWIKTTGVSPAGLSLTDLEAQMEALRESQS